MKDVLFLFSYAKNRLRPNYDDLMEQVGKKSSTHGYRAYKGAIKELEFLIRNNILTIYDPLNKRDISDYDLVFFRLWQRQYERATAAALYLKYKGNKFFDSEVHSKRSMTKLTDLVKLAVAGIPVPNTYYSTPKHMIKFINSDKNFGFPMVVKDINGTRGSNNFLANNAKRASEIVNSRPEIDFVLQGYIANDCDYRFLVAGSEIALVIKRTRLDDSTHLNNTSAGAEGKIVDAKDFSAQIRNDVIRAGKLHRREFSGVDVIIDKNSGKHYILEVNAAPDIVSKVGTDEKTDALHKLIVNKLKEQTQ